MLDIGFVLLLAIWATGVGLVLLERLGARAQPGLLRPK
jgi:hypothetical protein